MTVFEKACFFKILVHAIVSHALRNGQLMDFFVDLSREGVLGDVEVIVHLESEPERCRIPEVRCKAECRVCSDASLPVDNLVNPARRDPEVSAELVLTDVHWLQEFLIQDFTGMYRWDLLHFFTSMVVDDFNVICVVILPSETDSPLSVDANTVLSFPFAGQGLKLIGWRNSQVLDR